MKQMNWKKKFSQGKELIFSTASKDGKPNSIIVISMGFMNDKLMVNNCQMNSTIKNLQENNHVCVIGGYIRLRGFASIHRDDDIHSEGCRRETDYEVKDTILIDVTEVVDLDSQTLIFQVQR